MTETENFRLLICTQLKSLSIPKAVHATSHGKPQTSMNLSFEALPNVIYIGPTGRDQSVDGKKKSSDLKSFIIAAVAFGRTSEIGQLRQVRTIYI